MNQTLRVAAAALSVAMALAVFNLIWYGWLWLLEQSWGTSIMLLGAVNEYAASSYALRILSGRVDLGADPEVKLGLVALFLAVVVVQALAMMVRYVELLDEIRGGRR